MNPHAGTLLVVSAAHFAAQRHVDQRRKGASSEPYFNHVSEVAKTLADATHGSDPGLIAAGYLHDTIEDQNVTYGELVEQFGQDVAELVLEVTDDKTLAKEARKQAQIDHAPYKSQRAKMLKIADKCSNLRSLLTSPPAGWTLERKLTYFDWADAVVAGCRGVNAELDAAFDKLMARRGEIAADSAVA
jgi:guanosine-3',5'-bis(diphosphate) 3'-pyrophosphohydrolase